MGARAFVFERLRSRLFYGWVVLGVATMAMFASGPGQSHTFSIFVDPISAELGVSTTAIASAYALATLIAAFGLTRMGFLVDRFGPRRALIGVSIVLGLACFVFGAATGVITLSLGFMLLRFFGQGSMMLGASNLVAQWFVAKRGVAMSVMMLGFSASMALHPPLSQWLVETLGWRMAWVALGVMTWAMMAPLLVVLVYDKPEPLGLSPDGAPPSDAGAAVVSGLPLREAMRTHAFWIIAAGLFTPAMLITTLFFFQVSVFEQQGLSRELAARMFSVSGLSMALSMPLIGWLLDRTNPKYVFSASLALLAMSLVNITLVTDAASAVGYAILFGVNTAANMTFFGFMWANYFGRKHLGSIQGVGQTIGVVGASIGPLPLGFAYDFYGAYDGALQLLAVLPMICAALALFLVKPVIPHEEAQSGER